MQETYIQDQTFNQTIELVKGEYDNCVFNNCNFSNANFSGFTFIDCTFGSCNLSMTKIQQAAFRDVQFKNCKMLGIHFDTCSQFGLSFLFEGCQLNHSSFYKTNIQKTLFKNSQLQETDFAEANLTHAVFDNCNLEAAIFDHTTLEKADFRTSYNFTIDPETNSIKKAKFSTSGLHGLLYKYGIVIE